MSDMSVLTVGGCEKLFTVGGRTFVVCHRHTNLYIALVFRGGTGLGTPLCRLHTTVLLYMHA